MDVASVALYIGIGAVALVGRNHILNIGAFAAFLLWGLSVADDDLTMGIAICLVGAYFLWRSFESWLAGR